jgi:hypothetical protein
MITIKEKIKIVAFFSNDADLIENIYQVSEKYLFSK